MRILKFISGFVWVRNCCVLLIICLIFLPHGVKGQNVKKVRMRYPDGRLQISGKIKSLHDTTGIWLYFDEAGRVRRKEKWKDGNRQWVVEYNELHVKIRGINKYGEQIIYKGCNCPK